MRNKVSALMDGELDNQNIEDVLTELKKKDELRNDWGTYHLIGDTLRQSTKLSINISQSISEKLAAEPTVLMPYSSKHKYRKRKIFAYSIAASVMAMVGAWLGLQNLYQPQQTMIADRSNVESNIPIAPTAVSSLPPVLTYPIPPAEIHDYLFVHREFSPGTAARGPTTDVLHPINPAIDSRERYDR